MRAPARWALGGSRLGAALGLSGLAFASCERDLEGAPCPCVDGYTCCSVDRRCYASEVSCAASAETGGAGGDTGGSGPAGAGESGSSGAGTGGHGGSANPSGGSGTSTERGGSTGSQDGGNGGLGEGGVSGPGGNGGENDGGTIEPPRGDALLPRFCNAFGWCGEPNPFRAVWGFEATDVTDVWVVGRTEAEFGDNAILHWDGRRWLNTPYGMLTPTATVNAVWGTSPENVWFVGSDEGEAMAARLGSTYWSVPSTIPEIKSLLAVRGIGVNNVWAVGTEGGIARWNGAAWSHFPSDVTADLNALWNDADEFWAVGASGTVARWEGRGVGGPVTQESVTDVDLNAVWGTSRDDVWVAGDAATLLHFDGSEWRRVNLEAIGPTVDFEAMTGTPLGAMWLTTSEGRVLYLEDGQWREAAVQASHRLNGIWSASNGEVWAVGDAGASVHLPSGANVDARRSWVRSSEPVASDLFGVWVRAPNDAWAVGAGAVLRWDGRNWSRELAPETEGDWRAVAGTSANDVWIAGTGIRHFDGNAWTVVRDAGSTRLRSVCALTTDDAWAVGDGGVILHFDGDAWLPSQSFPEMDLKTVLCAATDDVWAIDSVDGVLRWDGQSWSEVPMPAEPYEVRSGQILTGSAPDDVWVLSFFSDTQGEWLRTSLWNGGENPTTERVRWLSGIAESAHATARREFWLVGSAIWHAAPGFPLESHPAIGSTIHAVSAPPEATNCIDEDSVSIGPNGAWAVGSSGLLLEKQCVRSLSSVIVD
ncbi:MAG TPA: hypothetical protein VFZ53_32980 [Polyangiaceae bacterium]